MYNQFLRLFHTSYSGVEDHSHQFQEFFAAIMPPRWKILKMENFVAPYGYKLAHPTDAGGLLIAMGCDPENGKEQEILSLWFMPSPFHHFEAGPCEYDIAQPLGTTPTHEVYFYQQSKTISTWPAWKKEIKTLLHLK